jgi:hypothetical protein
MIEDAPAAPPPPTASLAEDFVDIFFSPREVFTRRATSGYAAVMIIVTLVLGGLYLLNRGTWQDIMDAELARAMAESMKQNPAMTEDQAAVGRKIGGYIVTFGAFIGIPIAIWFTGLATWLTARMFGAKIAYSAATMIAAYAYMPRIIESLAVSVQGILLDTTGMRSRFQLSLGVGRFLDPEMNAGVLGLAGRIDVFTLWVTVLIAVGLAVVAKLPRDKAVMAGAVVWAFGALPSLWALAKTAISG